jgi:hypothetical protein
MKISDLLRDFADTQLLRSIADAVDDQLANGNAPAEKTNMDGPSSNGSVPAEKTNVDGPKGIFIPPLQQKIELMKKSTGVQNVYDDGQDEDENGERHSYPELINQVRKNAGLSDELTDD